MRRIGSEVSPVARKSWFTTPFRPRRAIQAYVLMRIEVRNGSATAISSKLRHVPWRLAKR